MAAGAPHLLAAIVMGMVLWSAGFQRSVRMHSCCLLCAALLFSVVHLSCWHNSSSSERFATLFQVTSEVSLLLGVCILILVGIFVYALCSTFIKWIGHHRRRQSRENNLRKSD